jgi:hypothetical protein
MRIESKGLIEKIMGLKGFRKGIRTKRLTLKIKFKIKKA